jgi:signal transduction histidine kinase
MSLGTRRDDPQFAVLYELGVRSAMVVPLIARGELRGAMGFFAEQPDRFTDDAVALAQDLAVRAALAVDNARLYREAQEALRARDDVLTVVSHDLGNPLSAIRIGTSLLLRSLPPEEKDSGGWQHLDSIRQSAAQMERLIRDLIEVKRLEAGQIELVRGPQRVAGLLAEAREMFAGIAAEKGIAFHIDVAPAVTLVDADRQRTLQVISNLLGNAFKFTPAGGTVRLGAAGDAAEVEFSVADTGPGIPPEHIEQVFERFWQAKRTRQGIGLGLAIARTIVQAHGGRIWVESAPGEGSIFRFTLPAAVAGSLRPE